MRVKKIVLKILWFIGLVALASLFRQIQLEFQQTLKETLRFGSLYWVAFAIILILSGDIWPYCLSNHGNPK